MGSDANSDEEARVEATEGRWRSRVTWKKGSRDGEGKYLE